VQTIVEQQSAPGLALAVARDGEPTYFHGFGYRNLAQQLPVTAETVFGVASVTKSVTCLAIMQLADRGRLAVSDPVVKWLPEFRVPHPEWSRQITIRHLMTHSSGLPDLPCMLRAMAGSVRRDPDWQRLGFPLDPQSLDPIRTYEELLRALSETEYQLLGAPGAGFHYNNEGYGLLQGIIERAAGQDFLTYALENILDPIGMTHSTFRVGQLARFPEVAELYAAEEREVFHAPAWWDYAEIYTSSTLKASAGDLLKYLEVYRTGGMAGSVRILSEGAVRQMMTPHVPRPNGGVPYGYGLDVETSPYGFTIVSHWGSSKGIASYVGLIPELGLTAVALSNLSGFGIQGVGRAALECAAE
jgi:CubicO group peptidase (beta-lactamase class C family)